MKREEIKLLLTEKFKSFNNCYQSIKFGFPEVYQKIIETTAYLQTATFSERLYHILNDILEPVICECGKPVFFWYFNRGYSKYCKLCSVKYRTGTKFENRMNILCDYGCGNIANYIQSSGKYSCHKSYLKCPENRKKYSCPKDKNPMYGKISAKRYSLEDWKRYHPILFDYEELREISHIIEGKCKNCNCWFPLKFGQLGMRAESLEKGCKRTYLFCSENCKLTSGLFKLKYEPGDLKQYCEYSRRVKLKTEANIRKFKDKILNIEFRDRYHPIDHKYSIRKGFENNILPEIISHWKNLEIISIYENSKKHKQCSITLEELIEQIQEEF